MSENASPTQLKCPNNSANSIHVSLFTRLQRHPLPIEAHFERCLVLTYALPSQVLRPLIPPGLTVDTFGDLGFIAIALVQTRNLRPAGLPSSLGKDFFLSGYRVFTRYASRTGRTLRGLRILRSDADSRLMTCVGNLLTHYNYHRARVSCRETEIGFNIRVQTADKASDLDVDVDLADIVDSPPQGSPFASIAESRRFAGPLPYTFDYERATNSIVLIHGIRQAWKPRPVQVAVHRCSFFDAPHFKNCSPALASAFYLENIPYRWERGIREPLDQVPA